MSLRTTFSQLIKGSGEEVGTLLNPLRVKEVGSIAISEADGANTAIGATTDAAATSSTDPWSLVALLKGIWSKLATVKTIKTVSGSLAADTDVITAVANKRLKIIAYSLTSQGTNQNTIIFKSNGVGGTELWRLSLQAVAGATTGANLSIKSPDFIFATVAGEKLTMDVSQVDTIHYSITYFDDDAS